MVKEYQIEQKCIILQKQNKTIQYTEATTNQQRRKKTIKYHNKTHNKTQQLMLKAIKE